MSNASASQGPGGLTRRGVLRAGSAAALASGLSCARTGSRAPRARGVLLLIADDLGRRDLGAYGNRSLDTPALDALAAEGLRLDRVYTPTSLCRPSRASILSGLYPHRTGRSWYGELREDLAIWPDHFGAAGVATGIFGKTAVAKNAARWDFCEGGKAGHARNRDPAFFAGATTRFLEASGERPFALVINFFAPHRPSPEIAAAERAAAGQVELARIEPHPFMPGTEEVKRELHSYFRDVERLDDSVAAVLAALAAEGRADDTLVVFTSDNGADFPFAKATLHEAGINMPCLARWPGVIAPGRTSQALVSFIDLLPTALDALGLSAPADADGRSFRALLEGSSDAHREEIFGELDEHRDEPATPSRAVVGERYKYVRHFRLEQPFESAALRTTSWRSMSEAARDDPALARRMHRLQVRPREELYDLSSDPWELLDLAADPALADTKAALAARLHDWMSRERDVLLAEWDA